MATASPAPSIEVDSLNEKDHTSSTNVTSDDPSKGHDNHAFDLSHEDEEKKSNSGSDSTSASSSGSSSSPAEAVNLELVDLSPPKIMAATSEDVEKGQKKAKEAQGGFGEYFVPVNEHKKGLRGEKLYVTKDNRVPNKKRGCKSCCGILGALFLIAAITVAVLVGLGVIDPTPEDQQRNHHDHTTALPVPLNGKGPRLEGVLHPDADPEFEIDDNELFDNVEVIGGPEYDSENKGEELDYENEQALDELMDQFPEGSVPNALDAQFRIVNAEWDDRLSDARSNLYAELAAKLETEVKNMLLDAGHSAEEDFNVKVLGFSPGSIVVLFRISESASEASMGDKAGLKRMRLRAMIKDALTESNGYLSQEYQLDENSVEVNFVADQCLVMQCSHACAFSFETNHFECECSTPYVLGEDTFSCIEPKRATTTSTIVITTTLSTTTTASTTAQTETKEEEPVAEAEAEEDTVTEEWPMANFPETTTNNFGSRTNIIPDLSQDLQLPEVDTDPMTGNDEEEMMTTTKATSTTTTTEATTTTTTTETVEIITPSSESIVVQTPSAEVSVEITTVNSVEEVVEMTTLNSVKEDLVSRSKQPRILLEEESEEEDKERTTTERQDLVIVPESTTSSEKITEEITEKVEMTTEQQAGEEETTVSVLEEEEETTIKAEMQAAKLVELITQKDIPESATTSTTEEIKNVESATNKNIATPTPAEAAAEIEIATGVKLVSLAVMETTTTIEIEEEEPLMTTTQQTPEEKTLAGFAPTAEEETTTTESAATTTAAIEEENKENLVTVKIPMPVEGSNLFDAEMLEATLKELVDNVTKSFVATTQMPAAQEDKEPITVLPIAVVEEKEERDETTTLATNRGVPRVLAIDEPREFENKLKLEDETIECKEGEFTCANGNQCVARKERCDLVTDCKDGSDELDCAANTCLETEFQCPGTSQCLDTFLRCNGRADCLGSEDEHNCSETSCSKETHFFCAKEEMCIERRLRCDGVRDCEDGSDERDCDCAEDEFQCIMGGGCIMDSKRCDGIFDCADLSDEEGCVRRSEVGSIVEVLYNGNWSAVCSSHWTETFSDATCYQLGYSGVHSREDKPFADSKEEANPNIEEHLRLQLNSSFAAFEKELLQEAVYIGSDDETCEQVVSLDCDKFKCGNWNMSSNFSTALLEGDPTQLQEHLPSVAYIFHLPTKTACTVTIFSPKWMITSKSCIAQKGFNVLDWAAFGGPAGPADSESVGKDGFKAGAQFGNVKRFVSHPGSRYNAGFTSSDLALIELLEPFKFDDLVDGICLAEKDVNEDQLCVTAGWSSQSGAPGLLQYVSFLPEANFDLSQCNNTEHYNGLLDDSSICSGARTAETQCRDDIGAPLMCSDDIGTWRLYGLLSREGACRPSAHPDVFASVSDASEWIQRTVGIDG